MEFLALKFQRFHSNRPTPYPSVLDFWKIKFEKSCSTNWIFYLQQSISKLIFAGYAGSKNPVRNGLKIHFVELDFSKIKYRWIGRYTKIIPVPNCQFESRVSRKEPFSFFRIFFNQITVHSYVFVVKSRISQKCIKQEEIQLFLRCSRCKVFFSELLEFSFFWKECCMFSS